MARDPLAPLAPGTEKKRQRLFSRNATTESFAMVQPKINAKVSSAALRKIGDDNTAAARRRRRLVAQQDRAWQVKAFDFADLIGELGYLLSLQANVVALCDFAVRRWDEDDGGWVGNDDPEHDGYDHRPGNVMEAFVGPTGGVRELMRRGAYHLFCTGETTLLATKLKSGNGLLWEFVSIEELVVDADGSYYRRPSGAIVESQVPLPPDHYVARCHRSSPRFSNLAECEVRRVLPICDEIVNLTKMVDAAIKSKIPAGLLFIPEEMSFGSTTGSPESEGVVSDITDDDIDPFTEEILIHVSSSIDDDDAGSRLVPLIIRGPAELAEAIRHIDLSRVMDSWAQELRQEALGRLSHGLDAPPEIMSGRASVNHWTSAIIDNDFLIKHIQPIGQLLADFLTVAFLRPMLEAYEDMDEDEAQHWRLEFDPSPVTARADEAKSARDLAEYLSDESIVSTNGFSRADMVSPEQKLERRLWRLVVTHPTLFAPLLKDIPGFEDVDLDAVFELLQAQGDSEQTAPTDPDGTGTTPPVPTDPSTAPAVADPDFVDATTGQEVPSQPEGLSLLTERLVAASDAAVKRALERAGNRVRSSAQGHDPLRDRLRAVPNDRVMSMVTSTDLQRFGLTSSRLLDKAWDELGLSTRQWVRSHLEQSGVDAYLADEHAALAAHRLCEAVSELTTAKLCDQFSVGSNGMRVPHALVSSVLDEVIFARQR